MCLSGIIFDKKCGCVMFKSGMFKLCFKCGYFGVLYYDFGIGIIWGIVWYDLFVNFFFWFVLIDFNLFDCGLGFWVWYWGEVWYLVIFKFKLF